MQHSLGSWELHSGVKVMMKIAESTYPSSGNTYGVDESGFWAVRGTAEIIGGMRKEGSYYKEMKLKEDTDEEMFTIYLQF